MKKKEYPMDEDYNRALKFLTEQIAERDEMREQLKLLPPASRPEGLRLIRKLDKAIEKGEQALAKEYEETQNLRRLEDEQDTAMEDLTKNLAGALVHAKYRNPDLFLQLKGMIDNMPPEESDAFYAHAARHEAGDLIKIIAREGETREQTEEFLKNYRAAQNKKQ